MNNRKSVRDVIVDALDEARIVKRNQPIPGDIFVSALMLLKNRLAEYGNTNYLQFLRKELNFVPTKAQTDIGEYLLKEDYEGEVHLVDTEDDRPSPMDIRQGGYKVFVKEDHKGYQIRQNSGSSFVWIDVPDAATKWFDNCPDLEANNLQEVIRVYVRPKNSTANADRAWRELKFVAYEDFYDYDNMREIYSVLPIGDTCVKLIIREQMLQQQYEVKVMYNEHYEIDEDTVFNIPSQYIALFTAALVLDLARQFPRMSDSTVQLIADRLAKMEENVRRSSAVNKFIGRDFDRRRLTYDSFADGSFLGL